MAATVEAETPPGGRKEDKVAELTTISEQCRTGKTEE
jgi:hypothetical protein